MHSWFEQYLYPPLFNERENSFSANLLRFSFRFTFVIVAVAFVLNLFIAVEWGRILPMAVFLIAIAFLDSLAKRGKLQLAGFIYLIIFTILVFFASLLSGGIHSPVLTIFIVVSFFAGVLLGGRGGLFFSALVMLIILFLMGLDYFAPIHPVITYLPIDYAIVYAVVLVSIMGLLFTLMINLNKALENTEREIIERRQAETSFRKAEEKLQHIQNRYNALFEAHTDGIFFVGLDGLIRESNQQASRMLGYPVEDMIGKPLNTFVNPEEWEKLSERMNALMQGGQTPLYECNFRCQDQGILLAEVNAMMVYDKDGHPQGIQSIIRDISERKQNEEELHSLIHQLEDQRARIQTAVEVSKAAISILEPDTLSQKIVDLVKERFDYYYVGLFLLSEDEVHAELHAGTGEAGRIMLKSGHALPVGSGSMIGWSIANKCPRIALDVGLDAVHFDNPYLPETRSELALPLLVRGEAIGALTVQSAIEDAFSLEDIAVLQVMIDLVAIAIKNASYHTQVSGYAEELEQRVQERTAQLELINRELESFSYSVSHDLRTPLRAINGFSTILLEDFSAEISPAAQAFLEKIRQNATRMGELVDGLLAFSRLGRKKIQKVHVQPLTLVTELLEELNEEIRQREITIHLSALPPCEADSLLLKQVYANFLSNAIKFTRDTDQPRIEIGFEDTPRGEAYFVRDNGAGFDMKYVNRLFGVFQRLHRDDEFEGNGVGLAIIQRIILRHGGDVWADAEIGRGATFYFTLEGGAGEDVPWFSE